MTFGHKLVEKKWGTETWLANNDLYCGKILALKGGYRCSLHRHPRKHETFTCIEGVVHVTVEGDDWISRFVLRAGDGQSIEVPPGTWHQFMSEGPAKLLEISTHHDDNDVERKTSSGKI